MSDDEDEEHVALGEHTPVEGEPLARVSSRLTWPKAKSDVVAREGDTIVRTPEGPRELAVVLESVEETHFERRQEFESSVRAVIGTSPIPTADE